MEKPHHPGLRKPPPRGPTKKHVLADPFGQPVLMLKADANAIQAVASGTASMEQQLRAMKWILGEVCEVGEWPYRPGGIDGQRATDVALGRMFVGRWIQRAINTNISQMPNEEPNADAHDPTQGS